MIKIYYLDKVIKITTSTRDKEPYSVIVHTADQAKIELFSDSAKQVILICEDTELEFRKFISTFELIEAGGGVVKNNLGQTLMIFRNGRWDLPKGKKETGEAIEHCALREVEEECGVNGLTLGSFLMHTYHIYELRGRIILKRSWWWNMSCANQRLTAQIAEGITEACWADDNKVQQCIENTYPTIKDVFESKLKVDNPKKLMCSQL